MGLRVGDIDVDEEYSWEDFKSEYGDVSEKEIDEEASKDYEAGRKKRIEDYLNSDEPVDFEGEIIGPNDKLERIVKQYLRAYVFR